MNRRYRVRFFGTNKRRGPITGLLSAFVVVILLLGACNGDEEPVVDTGVDTGIVEDDVEVATPVIIDEDAEVIEEDAEAVVETEVETEGETDIEGDVTVITDTELLTGTEVTTDIVVTTDTVVLEQQLITTVITATDLVTDVEASTDTSQATETEVITDTADLEPESASAEAEADVEVTPIAPTPTPTVVVEVTRVVTETEVVTETVEVTAVATPLPGQEATPQPEAEAEVATAVTFIGIEGAAGRSIRASTLIGVDFVTADGEVSGEIEDLVINMENGQVLYALLEYGGVLDIGDTDMPVPLTAFVWGTGDELILNVDSQVLDAFPGVSNDWPVPDDDDWDLDIFNFWGDTGFEAGYDTALVGTNVRRASDLLDDPIADAGFGEGSVEDMIISLQEGRVTYVLVSMGGLGVAGDSYVIPFSAFDPSAPQDGLYLNPDFDASLLEQAPTYDQATFGQTGVYEEGYDNDWRSFWGDAGFDMDIGE